MRNPVKPRNTSLAAAITGRKGGIHWTAERQHQENKKPKGEGGAFLLYVATGKGRHFQPSDFISEFDTFDEAEIVGKEIVAKVFGDRYLVIRGE